jgi:hypothetical protein
MCLQLVQTRDIVAAVHAFVAAHQRPALQRVLAYFAGAFGDPCLIRALHLAAAEYKFSHGFTVTESSLQLPCCGLVEL